MKRITLTILIIVLALTSVQIVGAQEPDNRPDDRFRNRALGGVMDIVSEATGLEPADILSALRDGQTLAEVIEANGGDVATVEAEILATMTEAAEERVDNLLNNPLPERDGRGDRPRDNRGRRGGNLVVGAITGYVVENSDLTVQGIREQMDGGDTTLASVITAAGLDVETVAGEAQAAIETNINERVEAGQVDADRAAEVLENLPERIDQALNTTPNDAREAARFVAGVSRNVADAVQAELDLSAREVRQQIEDGQTLAAFIEANGGSVEDVIAAATTASTDDITSALAEEEITQEQADAALAALSDTIDTILNREVHKRPNAPASDL